MMTPLDSTGPSDGGAGNTTGPATDKKQCQRPEEVSNLFNLIVYFSVFFLFQSQQLDLRTNMIL